MFVSTFLISAILRQVPNVCFTQFSLLRGEWSRPILLDIAQKAQSSRREDGLSCAKPPKSLQKPTFKIEPLITTIESVSVHFHYIIIREGLGGPPDLFVQVYHMIYPSINQSGALPVPCRDKREALGIPKHQERPMIFAITLHLRLTGALPHVQGQ